MNIIRAISFIFLPLLCLGCLQNRNISAEMLALIDNPDSYFVEGREEGHRDNLANLLKKCSDKKYVQQMSIHSSKITAGIHQSTIKASNGEADLVISNKVNQQEVAHAIIDLSVKGELGGFLKDRRLSGYLFLLTECDEGFDQDVFLVDGLG